MVKCHHIKPLRFELLHGGVDRGHDLAGPGDERQVVLFRGRRGRNRPAEIFPEHPQGPVDEVAEVVGELRVDPVDEGLPGEVAVEAEGDLAQEEVAEGVRPVRRARLPLRAPAIRDRVPADARGGPRASIFHLQAGRARILAGQIKLGMPSLKRGLELFAQRGQLQRLHQAGQRIISELAARGLTDEAADMESYLKQLSPSTPILQPEQAQTKKPSLPTHCSACGAALRPDEVEWLDEVTAECAYCGSPVRDED